MDDEFNLLGAAQRQQNLKQNEATRQEIAALRADLARKEAEEKAAPKCPYCAGSIFDGVEKCRHCASDIKWCEVRGENHPIKSDEDPVAFPASEEEKLRAADELEAAEQKRIRAAQKRHAEKIAQKWEQDKKSNLIILLVSVVVIIAIFGAAILVALWVR
jgi:hypothetical protein